MATLFKLVIDATTTTTTELQPDIQRFYYEFDPATLTGDEATILSTSFVDDTDTLLIGDFPALEPNNGYYLLFINGVLQQESLYTVNAGTLVIEEKADEILENAPIVLVINNFDPGSDSDTTVNT